MKSNQVQELKEKILDLKKRKNAIILAHNYQPPEVQDIADFIGDSLELCKKAQNLESKLIIFYGVNFMAETAKILNPEKKVIIPDLKANCPLAEMLPLKILKEFKKKYFGFPAVLYINTLAEAKTEADIISTSGNADRVINSLDFEKVLFGPDKNLAYWAQKKVNKKIIPIPENGYCYVHKKIKVKDLVEKRKKYPDEKIIVHPECDLEVQNLADFVVSTSAIIKYASECNFPMIIVTEINMVYRLKKLFPEKIFIPLTNKAKCKGMSRINFKKVYLALKNEKPEIVLNKKIIEKAKFSIEKMMKIKL